MWCLVFASVAPRFTNLSDNLPVLANGSNKVRLTCTTDSSFPASTITWNRNGNVMDITTGISQLTGSYGGIVKTQVLEFVATSKMHGQLIECRASNGLPGDDVRSRVSLDIHCKY